MLKCRYITGLWNTCTYKKCIRKFGFVDVMDISTNCMFDSQETNDSLNYSKSKIKHLQTYHLLWSLDFLLFLHCTVLLADFPFLCPILILYFYFLPPFMYINLKLNVFILLVIFCSKFYYIFLARTHLQYFIVKIINQLPNQSTTLTNLINLHIYTSI